MFRDDPKDLRAAGGNNADFAFECTRIFGTFIHGVAFTSLNLTMITRMLCRKCEEPSIKHQFVATKVLDYIMPRTLSHSFES